MGITEPSITHEQPNQSLAQTPNQSTHKKTLVKALIASVVVFALLVGTFYLTQQPNKVKKESKPNQTIDQNPSVLLSTPIPPINIVKKSLYVETPQGQRVISTRVYNKNMYTQGVHDVPTAMTVELENGFVLTEYTESTPEAPNGTTYLWYYNLNTKELTRPNLPEKYSKGFDYATATKYDNKSVVINVAKYISISNNDDPEHNETYLWNTDTNTTKNLASLSNACGTSTDGNTKYICGMLGELVPANENEAIALYSFGDACYGESLIYKYNFNTDSVTLIDAFNNSANNYKRLMGFYKGDMLIAELEKLPQRTQDEFCPNTKTTKLYTMDISKKITKKSAIRSETLSAFAISMKMSPGSM